MFDEDRLNVVSCQDTSYFDRTNSEFSHDTELFNTVYYESAKVNGTYLWYRRS